MRKRIIWIDAVKGILIIFVIMLHVVGIHPDFLSEICQGGLVAAFFLISGFTFKYNGVVHDLRSKAKRLLIPYFLYSLLGVLVICFINNFSNLNSLFLIKWRIIGVMYSRYCLYPLGQADNKYFLDGIYPLWFLTCMFVSYIWVIMYNSMNTLCRRMLLLFGCLFTILAYFSPVLMPWGLDVSFVFALCIIFSVKKRSLFAIDGKLQLVLLPLLVIIYFCLLSYNGIPNPSIRIYGELGLLSVVIYFVLGVLETLILSYICQIFENTKIIHLIAWIGQYSLRLLCLHVPISLVVKLLGFPHQLIQISSIVFSLICCYCIDLVIKQYENKLPLLRYL